MRAAISWAAVLAASSSSWLHVVEAKPAADPMADLSKMADNLMKQLGDLGVDPEKIKNMKKKKEKQVASGEFKNRFANKESLQAMAKSLQDAMTGFVDKAGGFVDAFDGDGDGTVSKEEFLEHNRRTNTKLKEFGFDGIDVEAAFDEADKDKDGVLSKEELKGLLLNPHSGMNKMGLPGLGGMNMKKPVNPDEPDPDFDDDEEDGKKRIADDDPEL